MALEGILASPRFVFRFEERPAGARAGRGLRAQRSRPRLAAVVLPLGDAARTRAAARWRRPGGCRRPASSNGRCGGCSPIAAPTCWPRASRRSGCGCRISTRSIPTCALSRTSTSSSRRRCCARPSCSSATSSARTGRSSISSRPTTRSSTSGWRGTTAFPDVVGSQFRKVPYPDDRRRGLLGHGSILTLTSHADRTSPVLRGKWVMEVLLGTPPPPPPPDVPDLEATAGGGGRPAAHGARAHGAASREPGVRVVPSHDRSDRPGARELRRHRRLAHQGQRDRRSTPRARSTTARRSTGPGRPAAGAAASGRRLLVQTFTENLMTYALGRRLGHDDMPTVRGIVRQAAAERPPLLGVRARHRQEPGVPDEERGRARGDGGDRRVRRDQWIRVADLVRDGRRRHADGIHHRKARSAPHDAARAGRHRRAAVPRRDGAGARRCWSKTASGRGARSHAARLHRDGARRRPGSSEWGATQHLWSPAATGRGVRPDAERAQPARAVPQVPDHRQRHRRARRRSDHAAGDRRRPFPVERGVPDAGASEADRELGRARRHLARSDLRASASGRTRRFRRCSCASRTSIRPAAAPTATRASTPT